MATSPNSTRHVDAPLRDVWKHSGSALIQMLRGKFRLRSLKNGRKDVQPVESVRSGVHRSMFDFSAPKFSPIRSTLMSRPSVEGTRKGAPVLNALQVKSPGYLKKNCRHEYRLLLAVALP